jgi:hypothetical protein
MRLAKANALCCLSPAPSHCPALVLYSTPFYYTPVCLLALDYSILDHGSIRT